MVMLCSHPTGWNLLIGSDYVDADVDVDDYGV
jgi:hypothetical protein